MPQFEMTHAHAKPAGLKARRESKLPDRSQGKNLHKKHVRAAIERKRQGEREEDKEMKRLMFKMQHHECVRVCKTLGRLLVCGGIPRQVAVVPCSSLATRIQPTPEETPTSFSSAILADS